MRRELLGLTLAWLLAVAAGLGGRGYWGPDEPRHAEVSREALRDGALWVLHLHGEPYPDKPPLFFWLVAASMRLLGVNEFAARLPTALAALGAVLLTASLGRRLYGPRAGTLAGLALLTSLEFLWLAQRTDMNPVLTFFVVAAIHEGVARRWPLAFLAMGAGLLVKGPIAVAAPLLVLAAWKVLARGPRGLGAVDWRWAPLVLAPPLAWIVPLAVAGRLPYMWEMLTAHGVGKAVDPTSHAWPVWFYFVQYPPAALPWVVFLPAAAVHLVRERARYGREPFLLPLVWFAVLFVGLSLSAAKRSLYLLPATPALALAVGAYLNGVAPGRGFRIASTLLAACYLAVGVLAVAGLEGLLVEHRWMAATVVAASAICAWVTIVGLRRGSVGAVAAVAAGAMVFTSVFFRWTVAPVVDPWKSARPISRDLAELRRPGDALVATGYGPEGQSLYLDETIPVVSESGAREVLASEARAWVIARRRRETPEETAASLGGRLARWYPIGKRRLALVTNGPAGVDPEFPYRPFWRTPDPPGIRGAARELPLTLAAALLGAVATLAACAWPVRRA